MAQKVKTVREKLANGTYSTPIPLGANGENIDLASGHNLETALGTIEVEAKGNVQTQLNNRYTKTEVDTLLESMVGWETVETW